MIPVLRLLVSITVVACIFTINHRGVKINAKNTEGFKQAIAQVKKEVVQPEPKPEPAAPKLKKYFFDDFKGGKLKEHWEVLNPNPDGFIVENSNLLIVSATPGNFAEENVENIFRLTKPLPEGDWIMTAKFTIDLQTLAERPFFGLYDDKDNYILVQGIPWTGGNWSDIGNFDIQIAKNSQGKMSNFQKNIFSTGRVKNYRFSESIKAMPQPLILRLKKSGRSYFGAAMLKGQEEPQWVELEKVTALRAKGLLVIGLYQAKKTAGETTTNIDWVKIETAE